MPNLAVADVSEHERMETVGQLPVGQVQSDQKAQTARWEEGRTRGVLWGCQLAWLSQNDSHIYGLWNMKLFPRVFMFDFKESTTE